MIFRVIFRVIFRMLSDIVIKKKKNTIRNGNWGSYKIKKLNRNDNVESIRRVIKVTFDE